MQCHDLTHCPIPGDGEGERVVRRVHDVGGYGVHRAGQAHLLPSESRRGSRGPGRRLVDSVDPDERRITLDIARLRRDMEVDAQIWQLRDELVDVARYPTTALG